MATAVVDRISRLGRARLRGLRHFPNTAVGISQGLGGQALLWKALANWPLLVAEGWELEGLQAGFWTLCIATLVLFFFVYFIKIATQPDAVWVEYVHPVRANFFCCPCTSLCFIVLAAPPEGVGLPAAKALWLLGFLYQSAMSLVIYRRWLFDASTSDLAAAPYLMSVVPWFLLSALASSAEVEDWLGLPLVAMCFGVGAFFAAFLYPFVLLGIYAGRTAASSPPLFLLMAPLSAAGLALEAIMESFSAASEAIFGVMMFIFVLLICNRPSLLARPAVLGVYWAYVYPVSGLATLAVKVAVKQRRAPAEFLACVLSVMGVVAVVLVFCRMSAHQVQVCRGRDVWSDPLVLALDAATTQKDDDESGPSDVEAGSGSVDHAHAGPQAREQVRGAVRGFSSGCAEDAGAVAKRQEVLTQASLGSLALEERVKALEAKLAQLAVFSSRAHTPSAVSPSRVHSDEEPEIPVGNAATANSHFMHEVQEVVVVPPRASGKVTSSEGCSHWPPQQLRPKLGCSASL